MLMLLLDGENMYWILSSVPFMVGLFWEIYALGGGFSVYNATTNILMLVGVSILTPLYLLCISIIWLNKHAITYTSGLLCMLGMIVARVCLGLVFHKIKYGVFLGDVPLEPYPLLILVPSVIVLGGLLIYSNLNQS